MLKSFDFLNKPYSMMLDWGDFAHRQHLATSGDFLGCHYGAGRLFLASVGQRGAAKHPIVHGMPPTAKNS